MGDLVEVREAGPDDVGRVAEFFSAAWTLAGPDAPGFAGMTEDAVRAIQAPSALRRAVGGPDRRIFIALVGPADPTVRGPADRTVLGFAATARVDRRSVELTGLVLLPGQSGRGIGGRLLEAALRSARDGGFRQLTVRTELTNEAALRFYDRHGFVPLGTAVQVIETSRIPVALLARDV